MKLTKALVLALGLIFLAACAHPSTNPQAPPTSLIVSPSPSVTPTQQRPLNQDQFNAQIEAAGWSAGPNAWSSAVALCQAHTSTQVLKSMAYAIKPHQADSMYQAYADAVHATC